MSNLPQGWTSLTLEDVLTEVRPTLHQGWIPSKTGSKG